MPKLIATRETAVRMIISSMPGTLAIWAEVRSLSITRCVMRFPVIARIFPVPLKKFPVPVRSELAGQNPRDWFAADCPHRHALGEVPDFLIQSKRNKTAAVMLMRKRLKKGECFANDNCHRQTSVLWSGASGARPLTPA